MALKPTLDEIRAWPADGRHPDRGARARHRRAYAYELARRGELPCRVLKVGSRLRVVTSSLIPLLDGTVDGEVRPA